mmetsp:Transcript_17559/g.36574  ORF Transcript_17559/g.36574 Transcript_17559/m.36574 type:complete len:286 (+) Transcript_17559:158-1015(+)
MLLTPAKFPRRNLLLISLLVTTHHHHATAQQQPRPPLQPLGEVLHQLLDKDNDQKVSKSEVDTQLGMLEKIFQEGNTINEEEQSYQRLIQSLKVVSPTLFEFLDSNGDGYLSKRELKYVTKFEQSLKKNGGMRDFLRKVFDLIDSNGDDQLSADELMKGSDNDEVISQVAVNFHEIFPIRKTPRELESFVRDVIASVGGSSTSSISNKQEAIHLGMKYLDDNNDGFIQRKEVGKHYNSAGKKFMDVSKTVKQMGPMLAMFGGMDNMNDFMGGAGNTGFHFMGGDL